MVHIDPNAPSRFLANGYQRDDWVAVLLKSHETGESAQRILPVSNVAAPRFQAWLRFRNAARWNIYVSANALTPGRSRRKEAIAAIRHVVLDVDQDSAHVLRELDARRGLPPLACVLRTSPGRCHAFWRVSGFTADLVERLQKGLARQFGTDLAATASSQMTRLPGFINYKHDIPYLVRIEYRTWNVVQRPSDFPRSSFVRTHVPAIARTWRPRATRAQPLDRARRFLAFTSPATSGQRGDVATFRICCRLARGFALDDDEALQVLREWNARCVPPWSDRELLEKLRNARRYGRERFGGLVDGSDRSSSSDA